MVSKEQKKEITKDLIDKLSRQKAVIFFDYTGLKVNKFQE
ncbi:50S ribosomal protein L10, partial [Patescibacteria group bacterium]|nr:50S ribosomal protein L10 [Patescibacteria group bacterium]